MLASESLNFPFRNVIWVVGPPRCGTTVLASSLNGSAELLPECSVLTKIVNQYNQLSTSQDSRVMAYFKSKKSMKKLYTNFLYNILNSKFDQLQYERLIFKDPEMTLNLNALSDLWRISPRIIGIVRDPRDAVASLMAVRERAGLSQSLEDIIFTLKPYYFALIKEYNTPRLNYLQVRYEDIVTNNETTFLQISKSFDVIPTRETFSTTTNAINKNSPFWTPLYEKSISRERIGVFQDMLSTKDIKYIQAKFDNVMNIYNYS